MAQQHEQRRGQRSIRFERFSRYHPFFLPEKQVQFFTCRHLMRGRQLRGSGQNYLLKEIENA